MNARARRRILLALAEAFQQLHLHVVERVDVRETVAYRALHQRIGLLQLFLTRDQLQGVQGGRVFGADAREDGVAQGLVLDQFRILAGDGDVALGQHHIHVRQQGREERPIRVHAAQHVRTIGWMGGQIGLHGGTETEPARQHQAALRPAQDPGNGAQILDGRGFLARGGTAADVQRGDFRDHGRFPEILLEALRAIHEVAVGVQGRARQLFHRGQVARAGRGLRLQLRLRQQGRLDGGGHQHFQVAAPHFRVRILGRDDFALLRQTDLSLHGAGRLGQDGFVAGSAATSHGTAAAVEQAQLDLVFLEHGHQLDLGLVQFPAGGEETAVLVAVRVTEHDFLLVRARRQQATVERQAEGARHDGGTGAQVVDRFKQGDDVDVDFTAVLAQQAHFFQQQGHFEQVRDAGCLGDDAVRHRFAAVLDVGCAHGAEDVEFGGRFFRILRIWRRQQAWRLQFGQQHGDTLLFIEVQIDEARLGAGEQFAHDALMHVGILAQVERRQRKAEHLDGAAQLAQPATGQRAQAIADERMLDHVQVGQQLSCRGIRLHAVGLLALTRKHHARGFQPCMDAVQGAAVGLVDAVRRGIGRAFGQRAQRLAAGIEYLRQGQLRCELAQFTEVKIEHLVGLRLQGAAQDVGRDEGVAVAVAAYPAADFHEIGQFRIFPAGIALGQHGFQRGIQFRQFAQDRVVVERQAIGHFIHDGQFARTQQTRLPQGDDAAAQRFFVLFRLFRRHLHTVALAQQARDGHLTILDALALHFRRVRREDGADERIFEEGFQRIGLASVKHVADGMAEATLARRRAGDQMGARAADVMLVFRDIGQQRKVAEGARQLRGFFLRQRLQRVRQLRARHFIIVAAETDGQLAHMFDAFEGGVAQVVADGVAQQTAQLADIAAQQLVFHFIHLHGVHFLGRPRRHRTDCVVRASRPGKRPSSNL